MPVVSRAEQKRIVAKVGQLMVLCEELEQKIRQSESDGERLMEAAVHQLPNHSSGPAAGAA